MKPLDPHALRRAFGRYMTGVTVVTTGGAGQVLAGFTANSFASVSLDPPLLLVCPGKFLSSYDIFAGCRHFAVNVLAEGQEDVSNTFARFKGDRFARVDHAPDLHGVPLIAGALAQFSCQTEQVIEAGDHCILIGRVAAFSQSDGRGLGYADGKYFSLGLERAALGQARARSVFGAIVIAGDQVLLERGADGFHPPRIRRSERGNLRQDLYDHLQSHGVKADLGAVYSVFDMGDTQHAYLQATARDCPRGDRFEWVDISELPKLRYDARPIADMMIRFAREARTQSFSLYLGDAEQGDIHALPERN